VLGEMTRVVEFGGSVGVITMSHDQLARRFLNRFFPSLYSLDTTRYPSAQDICELYGTLGLTEIIQYEVTEPDANPKADFSDVLRLGQWSSLWQLPETERVNGTERILRAIDEGQLPKWPDLRTVIIGRK
jgi:hypothetical protein